MNDICYTAKQIVLHFNYSKNYKPCHYIMMNHHKLPGVAIYKNKISHDVNTYIMNKHSIIFSNLKPLSLLNNPVKQCQKLALPVFVAYVT